MKLSPTKEGRGSRREFWHKLRRRFMTKIYFFRQRKGKCKIQQAKMKQWSEADDNAGAVTLAFSNRSVEW